MSAKWFVIERRNIPLIKLVRARFQLRKSLALKIKEYEKKSSETNYQNLLFKGPMTAETTYDYTFQFDPKDYPANTFYQGRYQFKNHYYGNLIGDFDGESEEFACAKAIDQNEDVKFWVRNLVNPSWAFRLPLSNGRYFYPDFVALLKDGRIFVIEYKGAHLVEHSQEKKNIGELWEEKSAEKALFLMAVKEDEKGRNVFGQIENKILRN